MKPELTRIENFLYYRNDDGDRVLGAPPGMVNAQNVFGDATGLEGDMANKRGSLDGITGNLDNISGLLTNLKGRIPTLLRGDVSGLTDEIDGVTGDATGIVGSCRGVSGSFDECELTEEERSAGVHINILIKMPDSPLTFTEIQVEGGQ